MNSCIQQQLKAAEYQLCQMLKMLPSLSYADSLLVRDKIREREDYIESIKNPKVYKVFEALSVEKHELCYEPHVAEEIEYVSSAPVNEDYFNWFCNKLSYDIEDYVPPKPALSEIFGNADVSELILVGGGRSKNKNKNNNGNNNKWNNGRNRNNRTNRMNDDIRSGRRGVVINKGTGVSLRFKDNLKYVEGNYQFSLGAADSFAYTSIALNDPFDPYVSLGGKSANDFLYLMTPYRFFRVRKIRVRVRVVNQNFASLENVRFCMFVDPTNTTPTNMDDVESMDPSLTCRLRNMPDIIGTSLEFTKTWNIHDALGISALQYNSAPPEYGYDVTNNGSTISSPTKLAYLNICWGRENTSRTEVIGIVGDVRIMYEGEFYTKYPGVEATYLMPEICYKTENRRVNLRENMFNCVAPVLSKNATMSITEVT